MSAVRSLGHALACVAALMWHAFAYAVMSPLPDAVLSFDETIAPAGVPPLPSGTPETAVLNPFQPESAGDAQNPVRLDPTDAGDTGNADADAVPPAGPAAKQTIQPDPLEGPPIPLPPEQRMTSAASDKPASRDNENDDDNKPITLDFQHADLGAVLNAFARFTGLNIVSSDKVRGSVSLKLDKVPWRNAFDTLLDVNGLAMERRGNVVWVAPVAELAARERLRFETHARAAELEPLASRTFELHYARADDLRRLLGAAGNQRVLSKRGSVMADPRTNLLFVTDLDARLAQIARLIASIDRPTRQVLIEARIVEGDQGFSRNLGVRMSLANTAADGAGRGLTGGSHGNLFDLTAQPISGFDAATAGVTLFAARATRLLNLQLSALEAEGHGQTISSPNVVTADRMKAIVEQGTELPYQAKVSQGVSGVQFRRASLKLEVEPQITPDGHVVLDLDIAKDSVGEQTAAGPAINTKHVKTQVEVEDGGTVSIGGIYEQDDRDDVTGVPVLGKIPVLGALFRHSAHRDKHGELVVLITPRVVRAPCEAGEPAAGAGSTRQSLCQ